MAAYRRASLLGLTLWLMALAAPGLAADAAAQAAKPAEPATPQLWQPSPGHVQQPLWPSGAPDALSLPGAEYYKTSDEAVAGTPYHYAGNISTPTFTVYPPSGANSGTAVVVIPGGGFQILAMDLEGTEVCDWLTAHGMTCVLLKYRVPSPPYDWHCDCRPHNQQIPVPALEDVQRSIRLLRAQAAQWQINPQRIGVLGFSAGGYLVAEISTQFDRPLYKPVDAADTLSARPDFAVALYPGHIVDHGGLNPNVPVSARTPPSFILQAEDDTVDGVDQALVYYNALKAAKVPAELHIYARGGHAFGLRATAAPITHWPDLLQTWLVSSGFIPG